MIEENLPSTTLSYLQSYQAHLEVAVKQMSNSKIVIVHNDIKQNISLYIFRTIHILISVYFK